MRAQVQLHTCIRPLWWELPRALMGSRTPRLISQTASNAQGAQARGVPVRPVLPGFTFPRNGWRAHARAVVGPGRADRSWYGAWAGTQRYPRAVHGRGAPHSPKRRWAWISRQAPLSSRSTRGIRARAPGEAVRRSCSPTRRHAPPRERRSNAAWKVASPRLLIPPSTVRPVERWRGVTPGGELPTTGERPAVACRGHQCTGHLRPHPRKRLHHRRAPAHRAASSSRRTNSRYSNSRPSAARPHPPTAPAPGGAISRSLWPPPARTRTPSRASDQAPCAVSRPASAPDADAEHPAAPVFTGSASSDDPPPPDPSGRASRSCSTSRTLHELRAHQPCVVAPRPQPARPVVRPSTRLHPHQARLVGAEELHARPSPPDPCGPSRTGERCSSQGQSPFG